MHNKEDNNTLHIIEKRGAILPDILSKNGKNQILIKYPNGREIIYDEIRCDGSREEVLKGLQMILENWPDEEWDIGYFQTTFTMTADLKKSKECKK